MRKTESLSSLSSVSAQLRDFAEPSGPPCEGDQAPVVTAAVAAAAEAAETAGSGSDRPQSGSGGPPLVQPLPSAAAAHHSAAVILPAALPRERSEHVPSPEPSHVSLPMTTASGLPDAADRLQPAQSSSAAAHAQLPPLSTAEAPTAWPDDSSVRASSLSTAAPELTAADTEAVQRMPEPPALAAHMVALAEAEELERSLLTGIDLSDDIQLLCSGSCLSTLRLVQA